MSKPKPTKIWWLVPFFLGVLGGALGYIAVKDEDRDMAEDLLGLGILLTVAYIIIGILVWYKAIVTF